LKIAGCIGNFASTKALFGNRSAQALSRSLKINAVDDMCDVVQPLSRAIDLKLKQLTEPRKRIFQCGLGALVQYEVCQAAAR